MVDPNTNDPDTNTNGKPNTKTTTSTTMTMTSRHPQWTYFKLQLIPHPFHRLNTFTIDALTARTYLSAALSQFLGVMGEIETGALPASCFPEVWIRVPRDDAAGVFVALSSWVGSLPSGAGTSSGGVVADAEAGVAWRVCAKGDYLGGIVHGAGGDVFCP